MKNFEINKEKKKIKLVKNFNSLIITGPLGTLDISYNSLIQNTIFESKIFIKNQSLNFFFNKIKAVFKSVTTGHFLELNLNGIGYKSFKIEDKIALDLGYSNLIIYKPTPKVKFKNLKNKIVLFSINKDYLNNAANLLKNYSIPDDYKGKGILFKNEIIKLKKKAKT